VISSISLGKFSFLRRLKKKKTIEKSKVNALFSISTDAMLIVIQVNVGQQEVGKN